MPAQNDEIDRKFANDGGFIIVERIEEAMSAKQLGRPAFNQMLARVENGEADGVISWAPDRLARNAVDGGKLIHLLDQGVLLDLQFVNYTFENNTQGKFMLQIALAQSKHYSDNLSDVVRRGNRAKLECGWLPSGVRLGYRHDRETKTIVSDPDYFSLVQRMFKLMLTGAHRPTAIVKLANEEWGFRTPQKKRRGGVPLQVGSFYKMLVNPFYAGLIVWGGETRPGKHEPMITLAEFDRIQELLGRPGRERPQKHSFPFTGMIRCASCGLMVTAEHTANRYGTRYVYYHCTKRAAGPRCAEPYVQAPDLTDQIGKFVASLEVIGDIEEYVLARITASKQEALAEHEHVRQSLENTLRGVDDQLRELMGLRLRQVVSDEDFLAERLRLQGERHRLAQRVEQMRNPPNWFEPLEGLFSFSKYAAEWFGSCDDDDKRLILKIAGSNPFLKEKKLNVQARKPFVRMSDLASILDLCGEREDVPTKLSDAELVEYVKETLDTPGLPDIIEDINTLRERHDPNWRQAA